MFAQPLEGRLSDALLEQIWDIQQSLADSLSAAATTLLKAEQDTSGSLKDGRPHCAARIALSKGVSPATPCTMQSWLGDKQ